MNATIISIGTEILIGQIINTNASWMGAELNKIGINVKEVITVSDVDVDILSALKRAERDTEVILVTGGLGPTNDDITKKVIAEYLGVNMYYDENTYRQIEEMFKKRGFPISDKHKKQCFMPVGVQLLENKMGTAPGMKFTLNSNKVLFSMPGVPFEMMYVMEHGVIPFLISKSSFKMVHQTIMTVGTGESIIADKIQDIEGNLPSSLNIAYLPSLGRVRVRVSGKSENNRSIEAEVNNVVELIKERIGDIVYGMNEISLEESIQQLAIKKGLTVGTAESCTGGYVSHKLTTIPGSSQYYEGSIVSYSNKIKEQHLNVKKETLETKGAVSEESAKQMVSGLLSTLGVDIALSITGIAGPGGGSKEKPTGTVWVACGDKNRIVVKKQRFGKDRIRNIEYSSVFALNMLRKFLLER